MATFYRRALGALQRLYGFGGNLVGTDRMDLEGAIQLVHDVAREVEIASGVGFLVAPGWWIMSTTHTHAGSDTQRSATDPRTIIASVGSSIVTPDSFDIWLFGSSTYSTTLGVQAGASMAVGYPALPGTAGGIFARALFAATSASPIADFAGSGDDESSVGVFLPQPILLPQGSLILSRTTATASAGLIVCSALCWVGPSGVLPPGLP